MSLVSIEFNSYSDFSKKFKRLKLKTNYWELKAMQKWELNKGTNFDTKRKKIIRSKAILRNCLKTKIKRSRILELSLILKAIALISPEWKNKKWWKDLRIDIYPIKSIVRARLILEKRSVIFIINSIKQFSSKVIILFTCNMSKY